VKTKMKCCVKGCSDRVVAVIIVKTLKAVILTCVYTTRSNCLQTLVKGIIVKKGTTEKLIPWQMNVISPKSRNL
jgi:hypothetical protein